MYKIFNRSVQHLPHGSISNIVVKNTLSGTISPNPFSSKIEVTIISGQSETFDLTLFDTKGQRIKTLNGNLVPGNNIIALDQLNELNSGIYFIQLETQEGILSQKVIKN